MAPLPPVQFVFAGVATALGAAYVNAHLALGYDFAQFMDNRSFYKRLDRQLKKLAGESTLYRLLEFADPTAEALWFEGRTWTYTELINQVDRLAWVLHERGVRSGDFVAIFMTNSPEMIITIYAVAKLGAVAGLVNATLRRDTLLHCINLAAAKLVVATPDIVKHVMETNKKVEDPLPCLSLSLGSFENLVTLPEELAANLSPLLISQIVLSEVSAPTDFTRPKRTPQDIGVLIYTSGTTGKPKAVSIKNFLLMLVALPVPQDLNHPKRYFPLRIYSVLPLFHATCLFTGLAYAACSSGTFCLARKFSNSRFSQDLVASGATRMLYVGELCRYLLTAPLSKHDQAHKCIVAIGNGLQKDVWQKFKERYNIPEIRELYRSTEGIAKFDNFGVGQAGVGKVGFSGPLGRYIEDNTYLVRYDYGKENLWRDPKTGFCVPAKLGEPGEAIGRVRSMAFYSEYLNDPGATELKLVRDVFKKGDLFQRTGDLLLRDRDGWIRFHDRTGDTFRWKGENVSAGEVRGFISEMPNVADAVVFGVKLQGYDGQVGAAGISLNPDSKSTENACIDGLYDYLVSRGLPNYALPRLVRFIQQIATGATFKHAKDVVRNRPWQPSLDKMDGHRLYWLDGTAYRKLDDQSWTNIDIAKARL